MRPLLNSWPVANTCRISQLCRHAFSTVTRQTARRGPKGLPPTRGSKPRKPHYGQSHPVLAMNLYSHTESNVEEKDKPVGKQLLMPNKTYSLFRRLVLNYLNDFLKDYSYESREEVYKSFGVESLTHFDSEVEVFRTTIIRACEVERRPIQGSQKDNPLFWSLRNAFVTADVPGLKIEIKYAFESFLLRDKFSPAILATHQNVADMRFPYEWFPATRALQRTIHLHVGPTNSGKTYNALKALENAKSGIYAGPLRLLAHEVYSRFLAKGVSCALITGEEQRIPKDSDTYFRSCTVEMTPLNLAVDVAVIDEIQMIGDLERGWAWTQAFLGVQAKEVHLCGEERAVELIQSLCASIGDECIVHRYTRLSGLETMAESLGGQLEKLEKGDAVVSFSRIGIHSLKNQIQKQTGKRCAIVYGSLPPETRAQQASLFNDPDNDYDYLVASDAIGMGLNLEIKRVIFESTHKRDSTGYRQISVSEIKQIGGRAGRFKTASQAIKAGTSQEVLPDAGPKSPGQVTALVDEDLAAIIKAFKTDTPPLKTAGIQPPVAAIERLSTYFPPNTPLSFILLRLREIAKLSTRFHICSTKEMLTIADLIQPFPMTIYDRCVFLNAPAPVRDIRVAKVVQALARCVSGMRGGNILDIPEIEVELLDTTTSKLQADPSAHLEKLEGLHKAVTLYLWLSYRFSGVFSSQYLAFHIKELLEMQISEHLSGVSQSTESRRKRLESIRRSAQARQRQQEEFLAEDIPLDDGVQANTVQ
ncbi:P-loop containing nucleoside triphosphate hydrolase protein [Xylaria nigripes]|nr:P-loop containing nucleoside triphosphate hydrolase protein [Xylaria nigripes]